ncbi:hypothetical protein K9L97_05945 [Candidatus Woesearchaeota archaeon]|nr:hypothetical protein [Candidatus Woesearchaeota archaeon]
MPQKVSALEETLYVRMNNQLISEMKEINGVQENSFYQLDFLKSARSKFDKEGSVVYVNDFSPFGIALLNTMFDLGYKSALHYKETLSYGFYDPTIARYVQPVSSQVSFSNSQMLNPYVYMQNNPFRSIPETDVNPDLEISELQSGTESASASGSGTIPSAWRQSYRLARAPSFGEVKAIFDLSKLIASKILSEKDDDFKKPKLQKLLVTKEYEDVESQTYTKETIQTEITTESNGYIYYDEDIEGDLVERRVKELNLVRTDRVISGNRRLYVRIAKDDSATFSNMYNGNTNTRKIGGYMGDDDTYHVTSYGKGDGDAVFYPAYEPNNPNSVSIPSVTKTITSTISIPGPIIKYRKLVGISMNMVE